MKKTGFMAMLSFVFVMGVMSGLVLPAAAASLHKAIIVYHSDWGGAAPAARAELQSRGYTVTMTDNAATGLQALNQASTSLGAGDFLVVYLAGHGFNPRVFGDMSKATALGHYVEFNSGSLKVSQTAPLFEKIAQKGINLTVIDGSCNGGETVLYAMGQKYCALSTTGVFSPSLTNFPYPSNAMHRDAKPGKFGTWGDYTNVQSAVSQAVSYPNGPPFLTASWMNGEIVIGVPERINQRLFRNDNTDFSNLSLFLRPAIGFLTGLDLGGWNLHYEYCYLYRFIYPDDYAVLDATEKNKFTNNLQTYLATLRSLVNPAGPLYTKLDGYLNNAPLLTQAAKVYAVQYDRVWQTLANDPGWNITANPGQYAAKMKGLTPDGYKGEAGFLKIAGEIDFLMSILQSGFEQQEALLVEIDTVIRDLYRTHKLPDLSRRTKKLAWPPDPGVATLKYNHYEREVIKKVSDLDLQLKVDQRSILRPTLERSDRVRPAPALRKADAQKAINRGIELYKGGFKTVISDKVGFPSAALDAMKREKLEELIGKFKAISPTLYYTEGRISFLLAIVEDAMVKVQSGGPSPNGQIPF